MIFTTLKKVILNKLNCFIQKVFTVSFMPSMVLGTGVLNNKEVALALRPHNVYRTTGSE